MDGVLPGPLFGATEKPVLLLFTGRDAWDQNTCQLRSGLRGAAPEAKWLWSSFRGCACGEPGRVVVNARIRETQSAKIRVVKRASAGRESHPFRKMGERDGASPRGVNPA